MKVGWLVGDKEGFDVLGESEGAKVGDKVGDWVGWTVGDIVGSWVFGTIISVKVLQVIELSL